ncbi:MAG: RNA polymerase sigma factor [Acidimicrobiales bacterium]
MRLDPVVAAVRAAENLDDLSPGDTAPVADATFHRARSGDRPALEALIRQHWPRLHRIVRAQVGDRSAADDLTQEAFARVLPRLGQLSGDASLGAYLDQVARNLVRDRWRRRRLDDRAPIGEPSPLDDRPADEPGPEAQVLVSLDGEAVRAALARLPGHYREVLWLRLTQGMTSPEVAARLGCSAPAVRQLLHRALERLRAEYEELIGEPRATVDRPTRHG